jgi:hypothetical protein
MEDRMAVNGIYRGTVVNTTDPMMQGRIRISIPSVTSGESDWAMPCRPVNSTTVPQLGSQVWVMFEAGNVSHPVWMGCM